jgi:uncharacterized OB-fold protein
VNAAVPAHWFWNGEELLVGRCRQCHHYNHPPTTVCRSCHARRVEPHKVSGRGRIVALTVNRLVQPSRTVVVVELVEQPALRLVSNLVGDDDASAQIGDDVDVAFRADERGGVPVFVVWTGSPA